MKISEILAEVNPHNYDSDVDYYAARDAAPKQRSHHRASPRQSDDDADFMSPSERRLRADQDRVKKAWAAHFAKQRADDHDRIATGTNESATAGATSAANIGTVDAPQLSPGKARGKKSYIGTPGGPGGTKAPPQPKVVQPKNADGTAKNGLDMKGANLFGGAAVKRS